MPKDRVTEIELNGIEQEHIIEIDDRAATRQAIINYIEEHLEISMSNKFLERSEWHARNPKKELSLEWDYTDIVIHHQGNKSFGLGCSLAFEVAHEVQHEHMSGKFDDIGYHYIVACDGQIAEGRDIRFQGSHVNANNSNKIGILLVGDYSERNEVDLFNRYKVSDILDSNIPMDHYIDYIDLFYSEVIPNNQIYGLEILISALISVFNISRLGGHREFALPNEHRTCPGNVGMDLVERLRKKYNLLSP